MFLNLLTRKSNNHEPHPHRKGKAMSELKGGISFIYEEKPQQCDFCGKISELRPYGPKGETICYECGQKDPATTEKMMDIKLFGVKP